MTPRVKWPATSDRICNGSCDRPRSNTYKYGQPEIESRPVCLDQGNLGESRCWAFFELTLVVSLQPRRIAGAVTYSAASRLVISLSGPYLHLDVLSNFALNKKGFRINDTVCHDQNVPLILEGTSSRWFSSSPNPKDGCRSQQSQIVAALSSSYWPVGPQSNVAISRKSFICTHRGRGSTRVNCRAIYCS
jgi:hypothetical protein